MHNCLEKFFIHLLISAIEDDLKDMGINANIEDMSEEELTFYYFKVGWSAVTFV